MQSSATCRAPCGGHDDHSARTRRHSRDRSRPSAARRTWLDDDRLLYPDACHRDHPGCHWGWQLSAPGGSDRLHAHDGPDDERHEPRLRRYEPTVRAVMKAPGYWMSHYVTSTDSAKIQQAMRVARFTSGGESFEFVHFPAGGHAPAILISQGSGGHAYVFAEFGYQLHLAGFSVFIMPKHGGRTVSS